MQEARPKAAIVLNWLFRNIPDKTPGSLNYWFLIKVINTWIKFLEKYHEHCSLKRLVIIYNMDDNGTLARVMVGSRLKHDDVIKWKHFPRYWPFVRGDAELWCFLFDRCLNKRLSKQWWCWLFETLSCPLWRHRNEQTIIWTNVDNDLPRPTASPS